jgi:putative transposase
LRAGGVRCARKRVARLMWAAGLVGCHRRRRVRTTVAEPTHTPAPNLVARDFTAPAADRLWIGDSTFVPTGEGWLYLAVLLDAHSRRVVGWALADHLRTELTLDALAMALGRQRPAAGLVHHTDRGG